jgi:hypothetical protein
MTSVVPVKDAGFLKKIVAPNVRVTKIVRRHPTKSVHLTFLECGTLFGSGTLSAAELFGCGTFFGCGSFCQFCAGGDLRNFQTGYAAGCEIPS